MKKICALMLAVALTVSLCACNTVENNISEGSSHTKTVESSKVSNTTSENAEQDVSKTESVDVLSNEDVSESVESATSKLELGTTSKPKVDTTSKNESSQVSSNEEKPKEDSSSSQPTVSEPTVEVEPEDTPFDEIVDSVVGYEYELNGTIVDWFVEGELVYAIFKNSNRYAVFDTTTGAIVADYSLGGRPAEIHNFGNELWISYPDLKCIKIHNKRTFAVQNTISLQHSVSSFDTYGDYIVYTEDDQHVKAYRYNLKTSQIDNITPDKGYSFYEADVLVNQQLGVVYIGESGSTGSRLYCFDITTLELKSKFEKDNYGYSNKKRRTFLLGNSVYWGEFRIDAANVSRIDAQYTGTYPAGMLHVDDIFVVTTNGIYIRETYEQIAAGNFGAFYSSLAITGTGNIFMTENKKLYIFSQQ